MGDSNIQEITETQASGTAKQDTEEHRKRRPKNREQIIGQVGKGKKLPGSRQEKAAWVRNTQSQMQGHSQAQGSSRSPHTHLAGLLGI